MPTASRGLVETPQLSDGQARCKVSASSENPLVTEWPASEKANFEARLAEGGVVVGYSGCSMKVLRNCRVAGNYGWRRTTLSTDTVEIRDADELFAKLPLGAVSLEGELERTGRLAVQTTVSGQFELRDFNGRVPKDGSCAGATHVIGALSVGAFKLLSGGSARASGSANVAAVGGGRASSMSSESTMREAGIFSSCERATGEAPEGQCSSPIQVFLRPLSRDVVDRGPEGTLKVRFLPVHPDETWEVQVGDKTLCKTPCDRWVDPAIPYTLKFDPGFLYRNRYVSLPDLTPYASMERVQIRHVPWKTGQLALGIVMASIGGTAAIAGTVLAAEGCSNGNSRCGAGLITLPIGLGLAAPGVWFIINSKGSVHVEPLPAGTPPLAQPGSQVD